MYKTLKFNWEERNSIFFSSDWHTYHDPAWTTPIWEARGYKSANDGAEQILHTINEKVKSTDKLIFLGDGFLNSTDEQCLNWLKGIKCQNIYYMWGNHESNMFRLYKAEILKQYGLTDVEIYPLKMDNVTFIGNHVEMLVANHFPLRNWHNDGRSAWSIGGHSHLRDAGRRPDAPHQKALDCGWDYKCDVWSFKEMEDVMSTKSVEILDHRR